MSRSASPLLRALGVAVLVVALQALVLAAFVWPAANIEPRDLPVVVAGPPGAAQAFTGRLDQARPGAFDIVAVPDAATADQRLRDREAYGAFVLGSAGLAGVHVASAASPTAAQVLTQVAQTAGQGQPVPVDDVVPADADDPRGTGLSQTLLPLVLTSLIAGLALVLAVGGRWPRVLGVAAYSLLAGLTAMAVIQYGLGVLPGGYLANAAAVALLTLAMAAAVAGLGAAFGRAGIALAGVAVFLLGNPLSGMTSAPEMLPQPWGAVGQLLPPGAGGTLLRSVAFFDGAGAAAPAWVLGAWAGVGLVLVAATAGNRLYQPTGARSHAPAPLRDAA